MAGMEQPVASPDSADDREFAYWHRLASENLIRAVVQDERVVASLDMADDFGKRALARANNSRERLLAMGLLMTSRGIYILYTTGMETEVISMTPPS